MSKQTASQVSVWVLWIAVWTLVLASGADLGFASDSPLLLAALLVIPQLALGYVASPWAALAALPLAVAWAPLAHADCVAGGAECTDPVLPAVGLAVVCCALIVLGHGLRVLQQRRSHRA